MHFRLNPVYSTLLSLTAAATSLPSLDSALARQPDLSIFRSLLKQFDILDTSQSAKSSTIIAPNDDAYRALAKWGFNVSEVPAEVARALLTYHVLNGVHDSDSILDSDEWRIAHTHLTPPVLTNVSEGAAVKLYAAGSGADRTIMTESGLGVLGGVVGDETPYDHGVIHTLNSSMVLPHNISVTAELSGATSFLDAMQSNNMVSAFESQKDVTLFVPINAAMDTLEPALRLLSVEQMAAMLANHAVPGKVLYHDKLGKQTVKSLQGSELEMDTDAAGVKTVNGARLLREDVIIYGGVMHLIDAVLIPQHVPTAEAPGNVLAASTSWSSSMATALGDRAPSAWHLGIAFAAFGGLLIAIGRWRTRSARLQGTQTSAADLAWAGKDEKAAVTLV